MIIIYGLEEIFYFDLIYRVDIRDVSAILKYTRNVYYISNHNLEFARLLPGEVHFYDLNGDEVQRDITEISCDDKTSKRDNIQTMNAIKLYCFDLITFLTLLILVLGE